MPSDAQIAKIRLDTQARMLYFKENKVPVGSYYVELYSEWVIGEIDEDGVWKCAGYIEGIPPHKIGPRVPTYQNLKDLLKLKEEYLKHPELHSVTDVVIQIFSKLQALDVSLDSVKKFRRLHDPQEKLEQCDCGGEAMHVRYTEPKAFYCCKCWVQKLGNAPADWHPDCVKAYESV